MPTAMLDRHARREGARHSSSRGDDAACDERHAVRSRGREDTRAVQVLCEVEPLIDVIVAVHPRYADVDAYAKLCSRFGFSVLSAPRLPVEECDPPALVRILERRLKRHGIGAAVSDLFASGALHALEAIYVERGDSVREVLRVAQDACLHANDTDSVLTAQQVFAAQVRLPLA